MPRFPTLSMILLGLCALDAAPPPPPGPAPKLATLRTLGTAAPLTILPVRLGGRPFDRVTEVVGLLLEQRGMTSLTLGTASLDPGAVPELPQLTLAVTEAVKKAPPATPYALYAEFNGSPQAGLTELRAVLVDQGGEVLWATRLTPEDPAMKVPEARHPMGLSMILVQELSPVFGLTDETAKAAKPGPMARRMEERSGLPPQVEREAMPARLAAMRAAGPGRTLMVFPARVAGDLDPAGPNGLVEPMQAAGLGKAVAGTPDLLLKSSLRDPNEQKVLWDFARAFREHLRKNPPAADYAVAVDCAFSREAWEQGFVHIVVCDRAGDWVLVDFQNSHHPDYQALKPTSAEACRALAVKRLGSALK